MQPLVDLQQERPRWFKAEGRKPANCPDQSGSLLMRKPGGRGLSAKTTLAVLVFAAVLGLPGTAIGQPVVSWRAPAVDWLLHATTNLSAGSAWTETPPPYQTDGTNLQITEPSSSGNKYFRLHKP